jgi:hypothetical protein
MAQVAMVAQNNFGWEMINYPNQQLFLLNIPLAENEQQTQYVMNTLTGAWCNYIGWNANTFAFYNNNLYFGAEDGIVNQAYIGGSDSGLPIQADMQCAYNWLDEPGRVKRMTMIQPLLTLSGTLTPTIAVDTDFVTSTAVAPITTTLSGNVVWDGGVWDLSKWPSPTQSYSSFLSVEAVGHALAIRMRVNIALGGSTIANPGLFDVATFDNGVFGSAEDPTIPVVQVNAFNSIAELGGAI